MRIAVVNSHLELGYNEVGFLKTKKGLKKITRDENGDLKKGWNKNVLKREEDRQFYEKNRY